MHPRIYTLLIALLLTCRSVFSQIPDPGYYTLDCDNDSLGALPLTQLGTGFYMGYQGGLFPGGSNIDPTTHTSKGKKISKGIKPLNALGEIDYVDGDVILLGIGPSIASDAYNEWKETQNGLDWPGTNPCMQVKGNFIGGKSMVEMLDIDGVYWETFLFGLDSKNIDPSQVQVIWMSLMPELDSTDLDFFIDTVTNQYIQIVENLMSLLPNLQQIYLSGMHYTGYTAEGHELYPYLIEPYGYWCNLVVKNVIGLQIAGDPRLKYFGPGKVAPFITWGPYFWADGITPRMPDGLEWSCTYFRDDSIGGGFHLKDEYKYLEGDLLDSFFNTNAMAKIWYKDGPAWADCGVPRLADEESLSRDTHPALVMYPNPVKEIVEVSVPPTFLSNTSIVLYNSKGNCVFTEQFDARTCMTRQLNVHLLPAGLYHVRMYDQWQASDGKFIKID